MPQRALLSIGLVVALVGCSGDLTTAPIYLANAPSQAITMSVGQELDITVGTIGPGGYGAPTISSSVLRRMNGDYPAPCCTPGGPSQRFHFVADGPGEAVITLGQEGRLYSTSDTLHYTVNVH
jgi:hypothetical protein